jgi:hypothetical protein
MYIYIYISKYIMIIYPSYPHGVSPMESSNASLSVTGIGTCAPLWPNAGLQPDKNAPMRMLGTDSGTYIYI